MSEPAAEKSLYALALLYLACSKSTDGELNQTEVDVVTQRIQRWQPDSSAQFVGSVLSKALDVYGTMLGEADRMRRISACASLVRQELGDMQLTKVMLDLRKIVEADGLVSEGEDEFLDVVERAFGLDE
jgi:hypothetical protein